MCLTNQHPICLCRQIESLEREIIDLQAEFEFDRVDYLDTIRKQERQIKLLDAIIARIHPCLRRDCNYYNIDRIRTECKWNEEEEQWILPKLVIERTALPTTGQFVACHSVKISFIKLFLFYHSSVSIFYILSGLPKGFCTPAHHHLKYMVFWRRLYVLADKDY